MSSTQLRSRRPNQDKLVWGSRKNIVVTGVPDRGRRYLRDFYTTLIDIQWRWNLLFFVVGFVVTWLAFAIFYFLLCFLHGDLDPRHKRDNSTWIPCVQNVYSFTEAYLFSIETMSTIGYGWRRQTEACPGVYLAVMLQSVIGAGLQFALASLVVSKTRRANRRSQTILFSNYAVVYHEDGQLRLAVRIGDMRKSDVIGAHATGILIKKTTGKTGHKVPVRMFTVLMDAESGCQKLFLWWPSLLVHRVDQHSPFWSLSRDDLLKGMYELIVILDGMASSTSKPFQARKSYHSWEILWGHRFTSLHMNYESSCYVVNYNTFHDTYPVSIPLCSAMMVERRRLLEQFDEADFEDDRVFEPKVQCSPTVRESRFSVSPATERGVNRFTKKNSTTNAEEDIQTTQTEGTDRPNDWINESGRKLNRVDFRTIPNRRPPLQRRLSMGDALNMYRHRRSVTDTYLGTELSDEDSDDSEESAAILSIVSQQSRCQSDSGRPDVRDVFKLRRKSTTLELMFGTRDGDSERYSH